MMIDSSVFSLSGCRRPQNHCQLCLCVNKSEFTNQNLHQGGKSESEEGFSISGQESESLPDPEVLLFSCKQSG